MQMKFSLMTVKLPRLTGRVNHLCMCLCVYHSTLLPPARRRRPRSLEFLYILQWFYKSAAAAAASRFIIPFFDPIESVPYREAVLMLNLSRGFCLSWFVSVCAFGLLLVEWVRSREFKCCRARARVKHGRIFHQYQEIVFIDFFKQQLPQIGVFYEMFFVYFFMEFCIWKVSNVVN